MKADLAGVALIAVFVVVVEVSVAGVNEVAAAEVCGDSALV